MNEGIRERLEAKSSDELQEELDDLTADLKRSRLEADRLKAEARLKELDWQAEEEYIERLREEFDLIVEIMTERDGD